MAQKPEAVSAVLDYRINFFALEPVLRGLHEAGCPLDLYCSDNIVDFVRKAFPSERVTIFSIDKIRGSMKFWTTFHRAWRLLLTDPNFSTSSRYQADRELKSKDWRKRFLFRVAEHFPKMQGPGINSFMAATVGRGVPKVFRTRKVLSPSRTWVPEFLCKRDLEVFTMIESWDHPGKFPAGFVSKCAFSWTKSIGEDWVRYQGDKEYQVGFPMKHRYVVEHVQQFGPRKATENGGSRMIMYAPASNGQTSNKPLFREEMEYMNEICEAARKHNYKVFIKPKPQGNTRDFDVLADRHPNVILGTYKDSGARPEDYYLDAEYNQQRIKELSQCDLMINSGTTFGIDAAVFGLPVVQTDFRKSTRYLTTAKSFYSYHLEKYILDHPGETLPISGDARVFDVLDAYFANPDDRATRFSNRVRSWIYTDEKFPAAMSRIVGRILQP